MFGTMFAYSISDDFSLSPHARVWRNDLNNTTWTIVEKTLKMRKSNRISS